MSSLRSASRNCGHNHLYDDMCKSKDATMVDNAAKHDKHERAVLVSLCAATTFGPHLRRRSIKLKGGLDLKPQKFEHIFELS